MTNNIANGNNNILAGRDININSISIDTGRIRSLVENDGDRIKNILDSFSKNEQITSEDSYVPIKDKNRLNNLEEYYNEFIKKYEPHIREISNYMKDNDLDSDIDKISDHLKETIFTFMGKDNKKLHPQCMSNILNEHTKDFQDIEDKDIVKIIIYYLYRECFIGTK